MEYPWCDDWVYACVPCAGRQAISLMPERAEFAIGGGEGTGEPLRSLTHSAACFTRSQRPAWPAPAPAAMPKGSTIDSPRIRACVRARRPSPSPRPQTNAAYGCGLLMQRPTAERRGRRTTNAHYCKGRSPPAPATSCC